MSQVFTTRSAVKFKTDRQQKYFAAKKDPKRGKNTKHEQSIQIEACDWLRVALPGVHFRSDTGSGAFNSAYEKATHNRQQSSTAEPDITILAARRGYHALVIELKADGVNLRMKRNGTKIRVFKDKNGKIIGHDYKIRSKGDWASLHIEQQALVLEDYNKIGYFGRFAVGLEAFKKIVCWYFSIPYLENLEMF